MAVDERVLRVGLIVLALALLAGCLGSSGQGTGNQTPEEEAPDPALEGPWLADPSVQGEDGLGPAPVRIFDPTEAPDTEVDLAAHPSEADVLALAWIAQSEGGWTVWAAITDDGGANWTLESLHDPELDEEGHAFDPIVAFGPEGERLYVLYGGERTSSEPVPASRITLAVSQDLGETWDYRYVAEDPLPAFGVAYSGWDAMDLAVSPDTGNLHVTAQLVTSASLAGLYAWRSTDAGGSWEGPTSVGTPAGEQGMSLWPRIGAGHEGLVVVAMKGTDSQAVALSQDGGRTFGPAQPTYAADGDGMLLGDPLALTRHEGHARLELAYAAEGLVHLRSDDAGASFSEPTTLATPPNGLAHVWSRAAGGGAGDLHVLHTAGSEDEPAWWMGLTRLGVDGSTATVTLGTGEVAPPRAEVGVGDEYGGLAVAADGSAWAAWSDPRGADASRIALTHLVPT